MKKIVLFLLLISLGGSLNAALVAHYEFEDTTDDSTGNGHHLNTYDGGAKAYSATAIRGAKSYDFDASDNYLKVENSFTNSDNGTISFWIKTPNNNDTSFFSMSDGENIEILSDTDSLTAFYDNGLFGDQKDEKDNPGIYNNNWYMITITFNNNTNSEKMYIDGIIVALDTDGTNQFGLGKDLFVGGSNGGGGGGFMGGIFGGGTDTQYTGLMDDLRIYDHELTAGDVWNLFSPPVAPVVTPPVVVSVPISPKAYLFLALALLFIGIKQTKT
ncbi:MAG: LamG domain-containing protein [Campylobacterota bacterium]|nr:LamG domain-containing protein [Campylobacterota bacterium]